MKKIILTLMAFAAAGLMISARAQTDTNGPDQNGPLPPPDANQANGAPPNDGPPPDAGAQPAPEQTSPAEGGSADGSTAGGSAVITPTKPFAASPEPIVSQFVPPATGGTNSDLIRLNFRNAPLEMVLNYLSDAAGFIIILDTPVHGNVTVISGQPMTRDEAVDLLNSVLNQDGYAAIRDGRTLTIMDKNDAKTGNIPVKVSSDPAQIPNNDEIVTQVIPIRFVDAKDLVTDLASFVSPQATVVANDAGNSIVITDTQSNIRHIVEIIRAIDDSAEAETEIRVFPLKYASPTDVANELGGVFPNSTSSTGNNSQSPIRFGGGPFSRFFGGGGGGGGGGTGGNSNSDRIKKATQVTAVADSRIQAVIVTAPKDLMEEIGEMMKELDVPSTRDQNVYVYHLNNGDPQEAMTVLQSMFQTTTSSRSGSSSSSSTQSPLQLRAQNMSSTTSSSGTTTGSGFTGSGSGGGRSGGGGSAF